MPFMDDNFGGSSHRSSFVTSVEEMPLTARSGGIRGAQHDVETASTRTSAHYLRDYGAEFDDSDSMAAEAYESGISVLKGIGAWVYDASHDFIPTSPLSSEDGEINMFGGPTVNNIHNNDYIGDADALVVFRAYHAFINLLSPPMLHSPFVSIGDYYTLATTPYTLYTSGHRDENPIAVSLESGPGAYDTMELQRWIDGTSRDDHGMRYLHLCELLAEFKELFDEWN
ncbi:hypothetical protein ACMFMG_003663 [Clarireedia jacksonii]